MHQLERDTAPQTPRFSNGLIDKSKTFFGSLNFDRMAFVHGTALPPGMF